jgi:methanogenic corrinoid protein MtbC1
MEYKELSRLIKDNTDDFIENTMQCVYGKKLSEIEGSERAQKSRRDLEYIINYLAESVYFNNKGLFEDFSIWLKSLFKNNGMDESVFIDTYKCLIQSLEKEFQEKEKNYLKNIITDSMNKALQKEDSIDSFIREDNPYQDYADKYLDLLLENKKAEASQLITDKALSNMGVDEIYLNIFQPVQKEVGRLWHANKVSVAQEHYISSVTQLVMSQLYPHFLSMGGKKGSVVTTAVGNELHEIGIRMIADLLEVDGYDTIHLGANTPNESIVKTLMNNQTKLLGVSVTLPIHLSGLEQLINMIKKEQLLKDLKIMVGGYAFNRNPDLVNEFEIDEYSRDAKDAVKKANSLTEVVD